MNICLLGATGRVGTIIVKKALAHHDIIHALVRDKAKLSLQNPNLRIFEGNAVVEADVAAAMNGANAVICALNTGGTTTLSASMPLVIRQMKKQGIKRIVTIGTAGILQSRVSPELYRFQSSESKRKTTRDAEEHLKAYLFLKDSGLDWTIVCPTYLPTGERMGRYRYEVNFLPEKPTSISIFDTADFTFAQLFSSQFTCCRVGLTY